MKPQSRLRELLAQRVLLLDGATGTEIQKFGLTEYDFHRSLDISTSLELRGNNDLLVLTRPDIIERLHRSYLDAGADIITTCTFNAQAISQADYGTECLVPRINFEGAALARRVADEYGPDRFVAGSMGPTTRLLSISDDADHPERRAISYDALLEAYSEQALALVLGGVDILLIETALDPINAKAAVAAARFAKESASRPEVMIMVSATVTDANARVLSGQTIEAFAEAVSACGDVEVLGLNCSMGAETMLAPLRRLAEYTPMYVSVHPNAGLPNEMGGYDDTPETMAAVMQTIVEGRLANIIGGCCGTTPDHIRAFRRLIDSASVAPRCRRAESGRLQLSGLEPLSVPDGVFINIGERCNVAGSRKFLRLVKEKQYEEAVAIARQQVADGAMVIDVNMDDGLLDAPAEMTTFLNLVATDPEVARVPVMIDSSRFEVIEAGLKCLQGKGIVNSISLKDGEEAFRQRAQKIARLGAAVVVMAFDEQGQATSYERRIAVCERAYKILTDIGFRPCDIIFDPNILTVATGMDEHLDYAYDYVRAARWIRANLPGCGVCGGVSNLSFAFRGNNPLREAMHAVFLYHAMQAGMTMAIMNPATAVAYDDIAPDLRKAIEDVLFSERTAEAVERLAAMGQSLKEEAAEPAAEQRREDLPLERRISDAMLKGDASSLPADLEEALKAYPSPVDIISGPLMDGMNRVGTLFGEGKLFLPQVVKTARTMKLAVDFLQPYIESSLSKGAEPTYSATVLIATVKGDVHDIGKNIVGVILSCNNFRVIDLGVMVTAEAIIDAVRREKPDFVCLSGLITPSLDQMANTVRMMRAEGITVPVMIGGAATSPEHTAVKIAPEYAPGLVVHVKDASQNPLIAASLLGPDREQAAARIRAEQDALRRKHEQRPAVSQEDMLRRRTLLDWAGYRPKPAPFSGAETTRFTVSQLSPLIDWLYFYHAWKVKADTDEGRKLHSEAMALLDELARDVPEATVGRVAFFPARATDSEILLTADGRDYAIATPRKMPQGQPSLALCDFVCPTGDIVGLFAATLTPEMRAYYEAAKAGDPYRAMLLQTLLDRLAEATSQALDDRLAWARIRPAVGYPSLANQAAIFQLAALLDFPSLGITLTTTGAMYPQASVAGLYIAHPSARYFA